MGDEVNSEKEAVASARSFVPLAAYLVNEVSSVSECIEIFATVEDVTARIWHGEPVTLEEKPKRYSSHPPVRKYVVARFRLARRRPLDPSCAEEALEEHGPEGWGVKRVKGELGPFDAVHFVPFESEDAATLQVKSDDSWIDLDCSPFEARERYFGKSLRWKYEGDDG